MLVFICKMMEQNNCNRKYNVIKINKLKKYIWNTQFKKM